MRKRRWPWLVGAAVLIALAALLMRVGEDAPRPRASWERVEIPRRANSEDKARQARRQVLEPALPPTPAPGAPAAPARPRDPVLAALGGPVVRGAVVLEANAVRHSPLGQLMIDCINAPDDGEGLRRIRERTGLDPLETVDRIAVADDLLVFSGDFKGLKPDAFRGALPTQFGERGALYEAFPPDGGSPTHLATWDSQLVLVGRDPEALKQTLERIEGKRPVESGGLSDQSAYGDVYGVFAPQQLGEVLEQTNPGLGERLAQVATRVELHVDTSSDVGVSARVAASGSAEAKEMTKALGAALALARLKAQNDGKTEIAELLDMGRVVADGASFRLEAGVPQEWLERALKQCIERGRAARARRQAHDAKPE